MAAKKGARRFFILIKAKTDTVEFTPETNNITELRGLVGGFIRHLTEQESGFSVLCDEHALFKREIPPMNNIASWFYEQTLWGDVILCKHDGCKCVGWTKEECEKICKDYSLC